MKMEILEILKLEPIKKLFDALSRAIGKVYEPTHIKRMADAKAYEIEKISEATRNNWDVSISFQNDGTIINSFSANELSKRAAARLVYQEIKKQQNIESVVKETVNLLENETTVSKDAVSDDWIIRFINSIEDISDNEMQLLWAKILAGEIKQPNTCSLRTLEVVKNLSKEEAELFLKIAKIATNDIILNNDEFLEKYNIQYSDLLKLDDCGLVNSSGMLSQNFSLNTGKENVLYNNGEYLIKAIGKKENVKIKTYIFVLKEAGRDLLKVVPVKKDEKYIIEMAKTIKKRNPNAEILVNKIIKNEGNVVLLAKVDY